MEIISEEDFATGIRETSRVSQMMDLLERYKGKINKYTRKRVIALAIDAARETPCFRFKGANPTFYPLSFLLTDSRFNEDTSYIIRNIHKHTDMYKRFLLAKE
jgi:hypothetical protein